MIPDLHRGAAVKPICEVCVEGVEGALAAEAGGAHRIELCAGLVEGGTTPSPGALSQVLELLSIPTMVLVRPRGGDFLFTNRELDVLLRDVEAVREAGAHGIATGILTRDGRIDTRAMEPVMAVAGPLSVTFHRAFDMTRDPLEALEALVGLGVDRVLTSGQARSVPEGMELIRELVDAAGDRISIMPGGGIRKDNVREILEVTGAGEIHFTGSRAEESGMTFRNPRPLIGSARVPGEYERIHTDPEKVRGIVEAATEAPG